MAKFVLRAGEIEARQHMGPQALVVKSLKKGQQTCNPGDWLIEDDELVDKARKDWEGRKKAFDDGTSPIEPGEFVKPAGSVYVMSQSEFFKTYDLHEEAREDGAPGLYNVPHFAKIEAAQHAAATDNNLSTKGKAFHCTIGDDNRLYSITKDGIITQVPQVMPDPTDNPGFAHEEGARTEKQPDGLQSAGLHETLPTTTDQTPNVG